MGVAILMKIQNLLVAATALLAQPAHAQLFAVDTETHRVLGAPPESFSAPVLSRMCSANGAMQYEWGQTGVPLSSRIMETLDMSFVLPGRMAPFEEARPRSTPWSDRMAWMSYWVAVGRGDDVEAGYHAFVDGLAPTIAEEGWQPITLDMDELPIGLMAYYGDYVFEREIEAESGQQRQMLSISYSMGDVSLTCGVADITMDMVGEAFGQLPDGTPRPEQDEIPLPPRFGAQQCGDPNFTAQIWDQSDTSPATTYLSALLRRQDYYSRLVQWLGWKLDESGQFTPEEIIGLMMGSDGASGFASAMLGAMDSFGEALEVSKAMWDTREAGDRAGFCLATIRMQDLIVKFDEAGRQGNSAAITALERAAREKGISLD